MNAVMFNVLKILADRFERTLPHEFRVRATQDQGVYVSLIVEGPGAPEVAPGDWPPIARLETRVSLYGPDNPFDLAFVSWIEVDGHAIGRSRAHGPFATWAALEEYLNAPVGGT